VQSASPIEVYRNPAARFVAGFIGNPPMNILPATPAGRGQWVVAGQTVSGPQIDAAGLDYAIRPEDLAPSDTGLPATVRLVEPLGAHLLVTFDVGGTPLRAVLDSDLTLKPGDHLHLAPQAGRVRWFDPKTTLAVA
jgi:multiple sugar transport system ATP-binding protein